MTNRRKGVRISLIVVSILLALATVMPLVAYAGDEIIIGKPGQQTGSSSANSAAQFGLGWAGKGDLHGYRFTVYDRAGVKHGRSVDIYLNGVGWDDNGHTTYFVTSSTGELLDKLSVSANEMANEDTSTLLHSTALKWNKMTLVNMGTYKSRTVMRQQGTSFTVPVQTGGATTANDLSDYIVYSYQEMLNLASLNQREFKNLNKFTNDTEQFFLREADGSYNGFLTHQNASIIAQDFCQVNEWEYNTTDTCNTSLCLAAEPLFGVMIDGGTLVRGTITDLALLMNETTYSLYNSLGTAQSFATGNNPWRQGQAPGSDPTGTKSWTWCSRYLFSIHAGSIVV